MTPQESSLLDDKTLLTELPDDTVVIEVPERAPDPLRFAETALDPALVKALLDKGIETAFPIQELTLAMALRGQDVIGQARTGTGKTLGFGLPLLHRIDPNDNRVQALIVCPTRELTAQVAEDLQVGQARGLRVTAVYGGVPIEPQIDELKRAHVVVGTPGRLLDHLGRGTMTLSGVTELVLDEADEMLDMGFLPDVERLISACPPEGRHTMLFSATMATAIVSLARRYMNSPSFIHARSDEPRTAELVEQHFFLVHRMDKPRVLARIMQQPGREGCYVFSRTKAMCDRLVTELEDLGVSAIAIHGDLRQATREKHLDKFRDGSASILVATEVAARGLDVDNVTHVVNYDCPDDEKMYLHRIGRTARAGRSGVAITFAEFNEVDKLNVIRKAVGAHDGPLQQIFSTSPELATIFDLPDETPWEHLAKSGTSRRPSSSGRDASPSRGGQRGGDRGGRSDDRSRSGRGGERSDRGSRRSEADRSSRTDDTTPTRSTSRSTSPSSSRSDDARDSTPVTRTRTRTRVGSDAAATTNGRAPSSEAPASGDRAPRGEGADAPAPRKRARATSRSDEPTASTTRSGARQADRQRGNDAGKAERDESRGSGRGGRSSSRQSAGRSGNRTAGTRSATPVTPRRPTTSELITRPGDEARGEGAPRHTRRLEVENLP